MKFLLNAIAAMFSPSSNVRCITADGFKVEHPNIKERRAEAKEKLKQWGRKSMLEGGQFSRNITVLRPSQTKVH